MNSVEKSKSSAKFFVNKNGNNYFQMKLSTKNSSANVIINESELDSVISFFEQKQKEIENNILLECCKNKVKITTESGEFILKASEISPLIANLENIYSLLKDK